MIQRKHRSRRLVSSALAALAGLGFIVTMQGTTHSQDAPAGVGRPVSASSSRCKARLIHRMLPQG